MKVQRIVDNAQSYFFYSSLETINPKHTPRKCYNKFIRTKNEIIADSLNKNSKLQSEENLQIISFSFDFACAFYWWITSLIENALKLKSKPGQTIKIRLNTDKLVQCCLFISIFIFGCWSFESTSFMHTIIIPNVDNLRFKIHIFTNYFI